MTTTSKIVSFVAKNAIKEVNHIRNYFAYGEITFEQAIESLSTLRRMVSNVEDDLDRYRIYNTEIRNALREIKECRDMIYGYKAKLEFYDVELKKQIEVEVV